jgi:hypothetical protein
MPSADKTLMIEEFVDFEASMAETACFMHRNTPT